MNIIKSWESWSKKTSNIRLYISEDYNNLIEIANYSENKYDLDRSSQEKGSGFTDTYCYQEAHELATIGWKKGLNKMKKELDREKSYLDKATTVILSQPINRVSGNYVDIGRYLTGRPDCMVFNQVNLVPKHITIICKLGFAGGESTENFFKYGAKILSIVDYYERQNVRVKLIARTMSKNGNDKVVIDVNLKDFGEFLDMNKLIFALGHASFFRRIMFSYWEQLPRGVVQAMGFSESGGYGCNDELHITKDEEDSLCIDSSHSHYFDENEELVDNLNAKIK